MSAPLTLAEVRRHREMAHEWMSIGCPQGCENCHHSDFPCPDRTTDLTAATIEWLAERVEPMMLHCGYPRTECDSCGAECANVRKWLRGEA